MPEADQKGPEKIMESRDIKKSSEPDCKIIRGQGTDHECLFDEREVAKRY